MPVAYKDLGKKTKDLLSKKYDYKNELKAVNKSEGGLTIETTGSSGSKGLVGATKFTLKDKSFGELEKEITTCGSLKWKLKMTELVDSTALTVSGDKALNCKFEADYKADAFALQADINTKLASTLQLSANVMDGVTAGFKADLSLADGVDLKDYNFGAQWGYSKNTTLAWVTSKSCSKVGFSAHQKLNSSDAYGLAINADTATFAGTLCVGMEKQVDSNTTLKTKIGSCGTLSAAVEHCLKDPSLKLNFAIDFDATSPDFATKKFGLGLTFGDY